MKKLAEAFARRPATLTCTVLLGSLWGLFAYSHLIAFQNTGELAYLLFFSSESLIAFMYAVRSEAITISVSPVDWLLSISATFSPLLFSPSSTSLLPSAMNAVFLGVLIQIAGLLSLNRSFGIVPAMRTLKTTGMYRVVRHPLYASYFVSFTGYLLANTSGENVILYFFIIGLFILRIKREEQHLAVDPGYKAYMAKVPYRIIPFIF